MPAPKNLSQSIQARLLNHARTVDSDPNYVLTRYALERFLYRLSRSRYRDQFVLKGALLMLVWLGETVRPTRDVDLLGFGNLSMEALRAVFQEVCTVNVDPDGMVFDSNSIRVAPIREQDAYGGQRVTLIGYLDTARLTVQVDVGIGDAVSPAPEWLEYPSLLDLPAPRLRAYQPETSIAEKLHAMVFLGRANIRMKDFFDIYMLAEMESFDGAKLADAIRDAFERRRTPLPTDGPDALSPGFGDDADKRRQWNAFRRKNRLAHAPEDLSIVVARLCHFLRMAIAHQLLNFFT
jgi:hypothetical protein